MNQLLTPGQTTYRDFGPLHIRIDRHDEGVTITVTRHDILNRQFTNLVEGRQYLALLRDLAVAGKPMWLIESAASAWTSAAAVVDDADRDMIDSINTTMDAAQPERVDVSDIVDTMPVGGSWAAMRRSVAKDYTRTRVSSKPPHPGPARPDPPAHERHRHPGTRSAVGAFAGHRGSPPRCRPRADRAAHHLGPAQPPGFGAHRAEGDGGMSPMADHAIDFYGPAIADIDGEWVVTNICYQSPRTVGIRTVAVGPTTHAEAMGHALLWNAEPNRTTTWIIRRAVSADYELPAIECPTFPGGNLADHRTQECAA